MLNFFSKCLEKNKMHLEKFEINPNPEFKNGKIKFKLILIQVCTPKLNFFTLILKIL